MKKIVIGLLVALAGSAVVVSAEGEQRRKIPDGLVVLTFDDCNKSDRAFVAGVLRKHGFGATFYVTEGLGFLRNKENYVTWEEIVELDRMGFEIGNHTRTHPHMHHGKSDASVPVSSAIAPVFTSSLPWIP